MTPTLYHYVHCPFCVRVRMTLNRLGIEFKSVVVPYDDETTPLTLTGKKMLPILVSDSGAMNESLDIMALLDSKNSLRLAETDIKSMEPLLSEVGSLVHSLAMPFWIWSPEFNETSRAYFQKKKEVKRGPFKDLIKNQASFIEQINPVIKKIEGKLSPFFESDHFTVKDILIAAHLWGLYSVPEFQFSEKVHQYLQSVKSECHFNYYQPFLELI